MKSLKKLALATAIAAVPLTVNALEALDDEFLGDVTGQEGITIDKTYMNTIEEFKYVDGDGDGTGPGEVSITNIKIGNFNKPSDLTLGNVGDGSALVLGQITETGMMIDATANGVLITGANIGTEANILVNQGPFSPATAPHAVVLGGDPGTPGDWVDLGGPNGSLINGAPLTDANGIMMVQPDPVGAPGTLITLNAALSAQTNAGIAGVASTSGVAFMTAVNGGVDPFGGTFDASNPAHTGQMMATLTAAAGGGNATAIALLAGLDYDDDGSFGTTGLTAETQLLRSFGDGKDTYVGGIELGNANSAQNSIGSLMMLNQSNYVGTARVLQLASKWGVNQSNIINMLNENANQFIQGQVRISSKTSGTGVHIVQESGGGMQALVYTDTDGGAGGNQMGVIGLSTFRLADVDSLDDSGVSDGTGLNGKYLRGQRSEFDIDVEDGKLVLSNQKKDGSTILNKIFIGDLAAAANITNPTGVIGGIAILGNHWEGKTSIYAH